HGRAAEARNVHRSDHVRCEHATRGGFKPDDFLRQPQRVRIDPRQRGADFAALPETVHPHVLTWGPFAMHSSRALGLMHGILTSRAFFPEPPQSRVARP